MSKGKITLIASTIIVVGLIIFSFNDKDTPGKTTDSTANMQTEQISTIVTAFMKSTLGTLSNGNIDLEMALELTSPTFAQQIPDFTAIPIIYGIQQGPDDINVGKPQIVDGTAIVDVDGLWGEEVMQSWTFELTLDSDDIWRINSITPAE